MFQSRLAIVFSILLAITSLSAAGAAADDVKAGALQISAAWARATPKGAQIGGGYLRITNTGKTPDRLIGGVTPAAGRVEVHEMSMDGGVMKMRQLSSGLEIKPGETVELKPGGVHLMFVGLKQQLQQGGHVMATLEFEKAGKVDVDFGVAGVGAMTPGAAPGHGTSHDGMNMKMK
jgi:copper(I)-binding protein